MSFTRPLFRLATTSARPAARLATVAPRFVPATPAWSTMSLRAYSAAPGLGKADIEARIVEVLKSFEKVDPSKVTTTASFTNDFGLDSLDAVEVVMAVEEEFAIEIPDEEADRITTVGEAIEYISKTPEAR